MKYTRITCGRSKDRVVGANGAKLLPVLSCWPDPCLYPFPRAPRLVPGAPMAPAEPVAPAAAVAEAAAAAALWGITAKTSAIFAFSSVMWSFCERRRSGTREGAFQDPNNILASIPLTKLTRGNQNQCCLN